MKIRNKTVLVYDIEVFQNIFHCAVKNTETNEIHLFEISSRKNQLEELVKFLNSLIIQKDHGTNLILQIINLIQI